MGRRSSKGYSQADKLDLEYGAIGNGKNLDVDMIKGELQTLTLSSLNAALSLGEVGTGGGAGQPPAIPPSGAAGDEANMGKNIARLLKPRKPRDPKIDEAFAQAQTEAKGFVDNVETQRRGVLHDPVLIELSKKSDLNLEAILGLPPGSTLAPEHLNKARAILKSSFKAMKKVR
jgi:hypothetical protein